MVSYSIHSLQFIRDIFSLFVSVVQVFGNKLDKLNMFFTQGSCTTMNWYIQSAKRDLYTFWLCKLTLEAHVVLCALYEQYPVAAPDILWSTVMLHETEIFKPVNKKGDIYLKL